MIKPKHLDLFSGIGGFSYAAEKAGFETVGFCEIDKFCDKVLKKHWPNVVNYGDIHDLMVDDNGNLSYIDNFGDVIMSCKKDPKYDNAKSLYESGLSIQDCANFYGITRQAMHKILIRRKTIFRDNLKFNEDNHFHRGGKKASDKAHNLVETAIEKGILQRKTHCEVCNDTGTFKNGRTKIQAHHDDYTKPLNVRWLCQKCHHKWHKENTAIGENETHGKHIDLLTGGFP